MKRTRIVERENRGGVKRCVHHHRAECVARSIIDSRENQACQSERNEEVDIAVSGTEQQRAYDCADPKAAVTQADIEEEESKHGLFGNRCQHDGKNNKPNDRGRVMRVFEQFDDVLLMGCVSKFCNKTSGEIGHENHRNGAERDGR